MSNTEKVSPHAARILELHEKMTFHVEKSGVSMKNWGRLIVNLHNRSEAKVVAILEFLEELHIGAWQDAHTTWTLPNATDEMWENMFTLYEGIDFDEMRRLMKDYTAIRDTYRRFRARYQEIINAETAAKAKNPKPGT